MDSRSLNNRDTFSKIKRGYIFTPALLYLSYKNVKWIIFFRKKKKINEPFSITKSHSSSWR